MPKAGETLGVCCSIPTSGVTSLTPGPWAAVATTCRKRDLRVQVAPSVVYEALRTSNQSLRRLLAIVLTQACWARLMPEAYHEAREFELEATRLRSSWMRSGMYPVWRDNLRDWQSDGGFWKRVRQTPDLVAGHLIGVGDDKLLDSARQAANRMRAEALNARLSFDRVNVAEATVSFDRPLEGWDGDDVAAWRAEALRYPRPALADPRSRIGSASASISSRQAFQAAGVGCGSGYTMSPSSGCRDGGFGVPGNRSSRPERSPQGRRVTGNCRPTCTTATSS